MKRKVLKKKTIKKKVNHAKTLVNFRIFQSELDPIVKNARKYTHGNVSKWIRYAAVNFKPKGKNLV